MSMSHEDYLEAIVMLEARRRCRSGSVDIATKLDVSKVFGQQSDQLAHERVSG